MNRSIVVSLLIISILLTGCSYLYGNIVYEQQQIYKENMIFDFELPEANQNYTILYEFHFNSKGLDLQTILDIEVIDPDNNTILTRADKIYGLTQRKTALGLEDSVKLSPPIKIISSKEGKYQLKIKERKDEQFSEFKGGDFIKMKVYLDDAKERLLN